MQVRLKLVEPQFRRAHLFQLPTQQNRLERNHKRTA